jgi:predicted Zn-dependent peptidase
VAHDLVSQWVKKNGKIISEKEWRKKIKAVTAEEVQAVAQEIFINKGLNLAIVGPHEGMEEEFLKILKF